MNAPSAAAHSAGGSSPLNCATRCGIAARAAATSHGRRVDEDADEARVGADGGGDLPRAFEIDPPWAGGENNPDRVGSGIDRVARVGGRRTAAELDHRAARSRALEHRLGALAYQLIRVPRTPPGGVPAR